MAARVQTFYEQTRTVQASFNQYFWSHAYRRTTTSRGNLSVSRPGRLRFDYLDPNGKVVATDGENWIYYEPGENGAPGQYARTARGDAAAAALGFLTGTARIERDFNYTVQPRTDRTPEGVDILELRPKRADPRFTRVLLYVDSATATAGVVRRMQIEDAEGNWNRFDFQNFRFNREVEEGRYRFQPPAGSRDLQSAMPGGNR